MPNPQRILIVLNVTHGCNLACRYCYYREEMTARPGSMELSMVETVFERAARSAADSFDFSIHGGEPLLRKPSYYTELFRLQQKHLAGKRVSNSMQTNATLIDDAFIETYLDTVASGVNLGLGISLDGPAEIHDRFRPYKNGRGGSFADVMRNIGRLGEHGIAVALLAVAPLPAVESAPHLYDFFRSVKNVHFLDLLVPRYNSFDQVPEHSLSRIYTTMFDHWFNDEAAFFDIRFFCSVVLAFLTGSGTICTFQKECMRNNRMLSIRPNGDVSFCDSYPDEILGNVLIDDLDCLADGNHKHRKRLAIREEARTERCLFCKWYSLCHGGCPSSHVPGSGDAHYFCEEYQRIFAHIERRLQSAQIHASHGLNDENLDKIVNPRLQSYLRARRAEREARREMAS